MRTIKYLILALIIISSNSFALEVPKGGHNDKRVRFINYKMDEVVKLVNHYGFSTHVEFSPEEKIQDISLGDQKAWTYGVVRNHLFIKAIENNPLTNMTVLTNRRVYNFVLYAHQSNHGAKSNDMMFQIKFRYPEDEIKQAQALAQAQKLKHELEQDEREVLTKNWAYWAKGSKAITPDSAYDDGRFTYFTFSTIKDMPAVYIVDKDPDQEESKDDVELESLVNTHIDPNNKNTIVVHKIASHFVLRKGRNVVCIFNKGFKNRKAVSNEKATTIKNIKRIIKK